MRQHKVNVTLTMAAIGSLGAFAALAGCSTGGSTDEGTTNDAALKAASPACASARDACKANLESIASSIKTACTTSDDCKAAFDAAKPELQAAAKACETSIQAACVVDFGSDGGRGAFGGDSGHGAFGGGSGSNHGGGLPGHVEPAACEAAEMTCRQALQSLQSMRPTACTTISTACAGQTSMTPTDACKTAIGDCKAALTTAAAGTHDTCGGTIAAACGRHVR